MTYRRLRRLGQVWGPMPILGAVMMVGIVGCASVLERNPVPRTYSETAAVPGIPKARIWGDAPPPYLQKWLHASQGEMEDQWPDIVGRPHHYLALSGGGPLGAFGAGLLSGWTVHGDRPPFTIVTGISAGALCAPFAFLGSHYDSVLEELFTQYATKDIIEPRFILRIPFSDAAADSSPLEALIATYMNEPVIAEIAAEHRRGRRLLIGTTNLDAERPVIWNIGAIAASGHERAPELIRSILLASASIPGAFPPVRIKVEAAHEMYDELHVDGGTVSMIFVYPAGMEWDEVKEKLDVQGIPQLYLIQNFFVDPVWREVQPKITQIAAYAMLTMIRNQGIGDLYRIHALCRRDGLEFNLAYIPATFDQMPEELFDPAYMSRLFEEGYRLGRNGYHWDSVPPGMEDE